MALAKNTGIVKKTTTKKETDVFSSQSKSRSI